MTILDTNKTLHVNDLSFHHKKLKNKEQMKYTISRKYIPVIKGQINEIKYKNNRKIMCPITGSLKKSL